MKPQLRPHHYAPRRRGGGVRYLLAGSAGIVCVVVCLALFSHLRPTAVQAGELPEGISSSQGESSASSLNQITVTPTAEPSYALSLSTEERPWYLRLVNKENPLPQDFTVELTQVYGGQFDSRAADALSQMLEDMEEQGLSPMICSSFRTWDDQAALHQDKIGRLLAEGYSQEEAETEANRWVVPAGASEHELGLAVDIVSAEYQILEEEQENTPEQQWLMEHCQEYGFILRYPENKQDLTGVGYEPWHYRYVGVEAAREIMAQGICLEEYLS